MSINQRILLIRQTLNLSQKDFATKIGLKPNSLCDIEREKCNVSNQNIMLICSIFNVNPEWLINEKGEMFKNSIQSFNELLNIFERLDKPFQDFILKMCYELRNSQDNFKNNS